MPQPVGRSLKLQASLILDARQLKQFRKFLRQSPMVGGGRRRGIGTHLPGAIEYDDFQHWLKNLKADRFSEPGVYDFAALSKHNQNQHAPEGVAMNYGHSACPPIDCSGPPDRCSVCIIKCHINYMDILTSCLNEVPKPMNQRWEPPLKNYALLEAYRSGKLALLHEISLLEDLTDLATDYADLDISDKESEEIRTARKALELYYDSQAKDTIIEPASSFSSFTSKSSTGSTKSVTFSKDTTFACGRSQLYFHRRSPRYEAGKWTTREESEAAEVTLDTKEEEAEESDETAVSEDDEERAIVLHGLADLMLIPDHSSATQRGKTQDLFCKQHQDSNSASEETSDESEDEDDFDGEADEDDADQAIEEDMAFIVFEED